jgi:hypothetical protein
LIGFELTNVFYCFFDGILSDHISPTNWKAMSLSAFNKFIEEDLGYERVCKIKPDNRLQRVPYQYLKIHNSGQCNHRSISNAILNTNALYRDANGKFSSLHRFYIWSCDLDAYQGMPKGTSMNV